MRFIILSLICASLLLACSCSSGMVSVAPENSPDNNSAISSINHTPVFVSEYDSGGNPREGFGVMGLFSLVVTRDGAELTPLRNASLEDVLEVVDVTNFLSLAPCSDCAAISSISLDMDGNIVVTIGIKHPFGAGDPLKPITGRNRADLHVFNVEGIILSNAAGTSFSGVGETISGSFLTNADGYTGYLDSVIDEIYPTDATVHPYILHFDDYTEGNFNQNYPTGFESVTDPPPAGNLVMAMGCDYDYQDYVFNLNDIVEFDFIFGVGCTYAVSSANKSERFNPEYRIPQHNKKAASEVSVEITRNELAAGVTSSDADLEIKVLDINHDVAVGTEINEMRADSSVGGITIDIPGVLNNPFNAGTIPVGGNGRDPADPLVFTATITNEAAADIGTYTGLVKVTDTYSSGLNTLPLLNGMDGIKRVGPVENPLAGLFAIDEFATYNVFSIEVATSNLPPIVELLSSCDPLYTGGITELSVGPGTMDQDGNNLVLYEFDFDYDGITFDVDASNITGEPEPTEPLINDTPDPVTHTFALRVTDDGIPPASGIGTVEITLHPVNSNGKNIPLRPGEGVMPTDIGVNETTGIIHVGFDDRSVWKYAPDYSSGSQFVMLPSGYEAKRLDVASNGYSLVRSDIRPYGSGGCSFTFSDTGTQLWGGSQGITHTAGVVELDGNWYQFSRPVTNMLMILTNWPVFGDVRWFQFTYSGYNGYSGVFTSNYEGVGAFDSELTVGVDFKRNPAGSAGEYWILEGAPRFELELFRMYFSHLGVTIGLDGGQSDGMDGFNDPKDVVLDVNDRVYVLDKLSTGEAVIKLFDASGSAIGIFGTCGAIGGDPIALDSDEGDGEIHVLHSNGVSVFYPSEIP